MELHAHDGPSESAHAVTRMSAEGPSALFASSFRRTHAAGTRWTDTAYLLYHVNRHRVILACGGSQSCERFDGKRLANPTCFRD